LLAHPRGGLRGGKGRGHRTPADDHWYTKDQKKTSFRVCNTRKLPASSETTRNGVSRARPFFIARKKEGGGLCLGTAIGGPPHARFCSPRGVPKGRSRRTGPREPLQSIVRNFPRKLGEAGGGTARRFLLFFPDMGQDARIGGGGPPDFCFRLIFGPGKINCLSRGGGRRFGHKGFFPGGGDPGGLGVNGEKGRPMTPRARNG